jgi:hypothetical protein
VVRKDHRLSTADEYLYEEFARLIDVATWRAGTADAGRSTPLSDLPALPVFDTFEDVEYRSAQDPLGFWAMLDYLARPPA